MDPLVAKANAFWPTAAVGGDADNVSSASASALKMEREAFSSTNIIFSVLEEFCTLQSTFK